MTIAPPPRRSSRLAQLRGVSSSSGAENERVPAKATPRAASAKSSKSARKPKTTGKASTKTKTTAKKTEKALTTKTIKKAVKKKNDDTSDSENKQCLPRFREIELQSEENGPRFVMGIDEAGRGPLAGPVVAAAAIVPTDIPGVVDSKKLTKEEVREELYEQIIASPKVLWAVAIVDAARIDEINILQATLEGMRMAATQVIKASKESADKNIEESQGASASRNGCYVVCGKTDEKGESIVRSTVHTTTNTTNQNDVNSGWYALVDGNRVPKEMPCECEPMVKGDSREYAIAAASILAKVTRDRLMHEYDAMYPQYELARHKGYPTAAHMALVRSHGASPIHRRTFAPLKHMTFDDEGRIVEDSD